MWLRGEMLVFVWLDVGGSRWWACRKARSGKDWPHLGLKNGERQPRISIYISRTKTFLRQVGFSNLNTITIFSPPVPYGHLVPRQLTDPTCSLTTRCPRKFQNLSSPPAKTLLFRGFNGLPGKAHYAKSPSVHQKYIFAYITTSFPPS